MREFQAKRRFENLLYSTGSILILLVVIGFLVKAVFGAYDKKRRSEAELARTQTAHAALVLERNNLSKSEAFLKTEEGVEAELRSKYRLVRPGENVAVIVDEENSSLIPNSAKTQNLTNPEE